MIPLVVLGAGGHGRDVAAVARRAGWPVLGFLDDQVQGDGVIGAFDDFRSFGSFGLIGLNDSKLRASIDAQLDVLGARVFDPSIAWSPDCMTAPGVVIAQQAAIGPGVRLGRHTHVGAASSITRAILGDFVTLAPGVTVCGDVLIGDRVQVGAGAVITNMRTVGDDAVIGAGAVVLEDVPAGATYVSKGVKGVVL